MKLTIAISHKKEAAYPAVCFLRILSLMKSRVNAKRIQKLSSRDDFFSIFELKKFDLRLGKNQREKMLCSKHSCLVVII